MGIGPGTAAICVGFLLGLLNGATAIEAPKYWPQSSGPNGNWMVATAEPVPTEFSVRTGKNILWTTDLPEVGQGGLAVWRDRIFLTIMKPVLAAGDRASMRTADTVALCADAVTGKILWQRNLVGTAKSPYLYGFSDSTTPGPITDGRHVWFYNASGRIACYDWEGRLAWERSWRPVEELAGVHFPFNQKFQPILQGNLLTNLEPYWAKDRRREYGWNYLYGIDKNTGKTVWISQDSLTHYNTPGFGFVPNGTPAILMGRGGYHKVPESPRGYSLIDLSDGKSIWRYEAKEGTALYNSVWNRNEALWFTEAENVIHQLDARTGVLKRKLSLTARVILRTFNQQTQHYELREAMNLSAAAPTVVFPAWYTNIIVKNRCYFMCFKKNQRLKSVGPAYCFGRIDLVSGQAEYLEVPVQYDYEGGVKHYLWQTELTNETENIRGLDVAFELRSKRDGWEWNFNPNPICLNDRLFFTTMTGIVYCLDTSREHWDEQALISVNDLGPRGKTWTLNPPSFSEGRIYHRTGKQLICIGAN
jgi:outer membrane protein assembly factor BamB